MGCSNYTRQCEAYDCIECDSYDWDGIGKDKSKGVQEMPNNRLIKRQVTTYLKKEDYNIVKFFALEHQVSVSKLIDDALYKLIMEDGDKFDYPLGGFNYGE